MQPRRPSGTGKEARFWQWVYDALTQRKTFSNQFITDYTTRGILRRPVIQQRAGGTEIEGDFVYTFTFKETPTIAEVENGFCYNATSSEMAAYFARQDPLLIPLTDETLKPNPDQATLATSRIYAPSNRYMRFQMTATKYANPNLDRPSGLPPDWDLGPFMFVKLIEMPFGRGSDPFPAGWVRSDLEYASGLSSDGFHVYNLTSNARKYLVIPNDNLLGIVADDIESVNAPSFGNTYPKIIRKRDSWGGAWLASSLNGASFVFSNQISSAPVYEQAPTANDGIAIDYDAHWITNEGIVGNGERPPLMTLNSAEEGLMVEAKFVRGRYLHTLNAQTPPLDGDTITFNEFTWTWRETVSDPNTEMLCLAYDPEIEEEISAAYDQALTSFRDQFVFVQALPAYDAFNRRFKRVESAGSTVFIQNNNEGPFVISITGNWSSLSPKRSYGRETQWTPTNPATKVFCINPRGAASNQVETTVDRSDWMRISLRGPFDETIALPEFENPFMVQVFFQPALRLGDPLQFPDGSTNPLGLSPGEQFGFTLTATPLKTL